MNKCSRSTDQATKDCPFQTCGCYYHALEGTLCEAAQRALEPAGQQEERDLMEKYWARIHGL